MIAPFIGGLVLTVFICVTALGTTLKIRIAFALLSIITFYGIFLFSFYEYDKARTAAWKKKEARLRKSLK